jgi:subtilisin family serine protease
VSIGLIDSGLDMAHPALTGQSVVRRSFVKKGLTPAPADHGTGIAALLIGKPNHDTDAGLLPRARLYSAEIFQETVDGFVRTSIVTIAAAINWMAGESLRVVNLSFAGSANRVLSVVVDRAARRGMILIAAAGNGGPGALPAFPAAEPAVIAVTALDAARRLYGSANRGDYIDFAAPGVDVWTARPGGGGAYRTGTSFAAPFVTAVAAAEVARLPRLSAGLLRESLRRSASDLGAAGRDPEFGWGLVHATVCADR